MQTRRSFLASATAAGGLAVLGGRSGLAQPAYPSKTVSIVVPFPAGGPIEGFFRPVAEALTPLLGQTVLVEPRPGANGAIALNYMMTAAPDGYTLLAASTGPVLIGPLATGRANYDPLTAFTPVAQLVSSPSVIVARTDLGVKTIGELIAYAKANPGKLNFGTTGVGGIIDLVGAHLASRAGINAVHVHYQGSGQLTTDMMGGRIDFSSLSVSGIISLIRAGKLQPLAVTNATRSALLPDVQTVGETLPGFQSDNWSGVLGPANMPRPIVDRLNRELAKAMESPGLKKMIQSTGLQPAFSSPEAFAAMIKEDAERWREAIRSANFKPK